MTKRCRYGVEFEGGLAEANPVVGSCVVAMAAVRGTATEWCCLGRRLAIMTARHSTILETLSNHTARRETAVLVPQSAAGMRVLLPRPSLLFLHSCCFAGVSRDDREIIVWLVAAQCGTVSKVGAWTGARCRCRCMAAEWCRSIKILCDMPAISVYDEILCNVVDG